MKVRWGRRGEAGISAGILIIALVLVSATAASALLDATKESAEQASAVAADAVGEIVTGVTVRDVTGLADKGRVVKVDIIIALQAGSPMLDLSSIVVQVMTYRESVLFDTLACGAVEVHARGAADGVLERGELAVLTVPIPSGLDPGERASISLIIPHGQTASERITAPDAIVDGYIALR